MFFYYSGNENFYGTEWYEEKITVFELGFVEMKPVGESKVLVVLGKFEDFIHRKDLSIANLINSVQKTI